MGELLFLHSVSSKGTVAKHLKHTIKDIENEIMSHVRIFYPLHSPDISTCSRGIQPILQKYEDAIESAKSAANALKRRLNLGFGGSFLCPASWEQ